MKFEHVTFAPKISRKTAIDKSIEETNEIDENHDWYIQWHGVRIRDKEDALKMIIDGRKTQTKFVINPEKEKEVFEMISEVSLTRMGRIKKWLSRFFG